MVLKDETGFAGKEIEREMLNTIIHCRVRETFELLKRELDADDYSAFPRRGPAAHRRLQLLRGIEHLAEEIFGMPVHVTHAQTVSRPHVGLRESAVFDRDRPDQIRRRPCRPTSRARD